MADGCVEIEFDEAWAAGSALLRSGDQVAAAGRAGLMLGWRGYGSGGLPAAGQRFADRFVHLLDQGLAEDAVAAGENLHATVRTYRDNDLYARVVLAQSTGLACA